MKKNVKCTDLWQGKWHDQPCVTAVASREEDPPAKPLRDLREVDLEAVKKELASRGIRLGQSNPRQGTAPVVALKAWVSPRFVITGKDALGQPKSAMAEEVEELSLSCGGYVLFLSMLAQLEDVAWMKGQDLELTELSANGATVAAERFLVGK